MRALLAEELEDEGYAVVTSGDGTEALSILERNYRELDLVITDIKHPGSDGLEMSRKIKERWPALPVIIYTAYSGLTGKEIWAAEAYIVKDADLTELKEKVRRCLNP